MTMLDDMADMFDDLYSDDGEYHPPQLSILYPAGVPSRCIELSPTRRNLLAHLFVANVLEKIRGNLKTLGCLDSGLL